MRTFQVSQLGSLGVWGSYKIRTRRKYTAIRTKAHFTGISNPNSQSILFLSNSFTCCPAFQLLQPPSLDPELISRISGSFGASSCNITISQASVKTPGKINIADFCHFPVKHSPGRARCVPALKIKPQKLVFYYRGVWEFHSISVPGRPLRARETYPQVIHRLLTLGEFGSLSQTPPCV